MPKEAKEKTAENKYKSIPYQMLGLIMPSCQIEYPRHRMTIHRNFVEDFGDRNFDAGV